MSDKTNLNIWAQRPKRERVQYFPDSDMLAQEIVEDVEAALERFREIAADLGATC
jgi:type I restriction enzyme M protein